MSAILANHGLNFRSGWLEVPFSRWDLLAPAWTARRKLLEDRGEKALYELDAFTQAATDFLTLQGLVRLDPSVWKQYRESEYDRLALVTGSVYPSPDEAHALIHALTRAMEQVQSAARSQQALDTGAFLSILQTALGASPAFRTNAVNGVALNLAPAEVEFALGALLGEIQTQLSAGASPIAVAAWAHHALSRIRPFADGNARAAFLLTNYILWRGGLPGMLLRPSQRLPYYKSLKAADEANLLPWGTLLLQSIQEAVLYALSWTPAHILPREEGLQTFNQRFADWRKLHDRERSQRIMNNRYTVFDYVEEILRTLAAELDQKLKVEEGRGTRALVAKAYPDSPYYYQFTSDIVEYARQHGYYFNRGLPRGWFKLKFSLSANKKYQLVFTLHHAGHEDATLVMGAFLHFLEPVKYQKRRIRRRRSPQRKEKSLYLFAPLPFYAPPIAFSIENDVANIRPLLKEHIDALLTQAITRIANEIY
ncbi:MAG: Fic family protein [Bacteroidia bacterium]|nr:Fic family protein [Bacteroidia bacterium]MCX7763915.1 Fic family protein [Bacteroidia bacterium]MDW8057823.1 Fic family protein [Bacteroidia bacterium]